MHRAPRTFGSILLVVVALGTLPAASAPESSSFGVAMESARTALKRGELAEARKQVFRALERDARSPAAWTLRARWAEAAGDDDERVYALHKELTLRIAQGAPRKEVKALRAKLEEVDPIAERYLDLSHTYVDKLEALAKAYRKARRPHSSIRVYQQVLALDPEREDARKAIEEISAAPDPSLAETAKPKDLLADVSREWIREFDAEHRTWDTRAKLQRENYTTYTDAGYEVMIRCAEAMEQMNAFYRIFFQYGEDGGNVPRIDLNIFKERDGYLKLGVGPPVDWSKGHFTGGAVETWIGDSGFDSMTGTLFHEAAHQFISLATNSVGWLNEGLACFFEGCRIQANGTVLVNRPATGRLFELARRMEQGWMAGAADGIDPAAPSKSSPAKAPTFRIVIENDYAWGPPWYAPTWGLVYFLYNLQDPIDGRFVYREAFRTYIDTSGGRTGKSAIENFEKVVLANPKALTKSLAKERGKKAEPTMVLPRTVDEVDALWKRWILSLRDEQRGSLVVARPYLDWARYAIARKDVRDAAEHFENGSLADPRNVDLLVEYADLLAGKLKNKDRATKLLHQALAILEGAEKPDEARMAAVESALVRLDRSHRNLALVHRDLERSARTVAEKYLASGRYLMAMHVSAGLGTSLRMPRMLEFYRKAVKRSGKTLALWQLAYNETDLSGWATGGGKVFEPYGTILRSRFGAYKPDSFVYSFLTMDKVTSGDFSFEADVRALEGENAYAGLVFGRKSGQAFHAVFFFPDGVLDLASFYGAGSYKTWRHEDVDAASREWHRLRIDIAGSELDVWFDDQLVASQSFPSREVLQGRFGLITGPGQAQFRNIRYLAREADDPGAQLEREVRRAKAGQPDKRKYGYHMGFVPPFPTAKAWVQAERSSWNEKEPVPTLLVLWSLAQNAKMPIHGWLAHVASAYKDTGLEIVSVCEDAKPEEVQAHLRAHPFPGSVAVDDFKPEKGGAGETMNRFAAGRKGYPWVLLLDIDRKVVWEGNPGFFPSHPWKQGATVHVDAPLADLVERRGLRVLPGWLQAWPASRAALQRGELQGALPLLLQSPALPADLVPAVAVAQAVLTEIQSAIEGLGALRETLSERKAEPALGVLLAWADLLEMDVDPKLRKSIEQKAKGGRAKAWSGVDRAVRKARKQLDKGEDFEKTVARVLEKAGAADGLLPQELLRALQEAAGDPAAVRKVLDGAAALPARWLARTYFGF